jgi:hypothetical protein
LVKFPSKYFDALPEAPEDFRGIAHTSTATLALESSDEEIAFVKDIYSLRTVHFVLPTLRKKIHIISNLMEFYAKKMDKWLGKIPAFDLRKEKQRLEDFSLILFRFLRLNGIIVDKKEEDTIELGFNNMFELQYVLVNKAGFASPLRIGFERFKNAEPIKIKKIDSFPTNLDGINELYNSVLNKTDIKNLASLAASAEVSKMPAIDVSVSLGEFALEEMTTEEVTNLFNSFPEDTKTKINVRMEEIEMGINIESADSFFFVDEEEEDT